MIDIYPFRSIMPLAEKAKAIACVPYDVISTDEAKQKATGKPLSFLHVIRPEIDFESGHDPYSDETYQRASENLCYLIDAGHLVERDAPALFVYRQIFQGRHQYGIVGCYDVQQYRDGIIKKHEKTRPEKEDDRTRHLTTTSAHAEPVFLSFKSQPRITELIAKNSSGKPDFDFEADDGVQHTIWTIVESKAVVETFQSVDAVYIADGHHRTAAAERAASQRQSENPQHSGLEEYNRVLSVFFPDDQLQILAYNRAVKDLNGLTHDEFFSNVEIVGEVKQTQNPIPDRAGCFCFYLAGQWHRVQFKDTIGDQSDPVASLDVARLQSEVLEPMLGVGDPRTDSRLSFIGGIRGTEALQRLVDSGEQAIAFSMYPTSMEQLISVSDAGKIMPPKSTWFEPKLRSGLFVHQFERF